MANCQIWDGLILKSLFTSGIQNIEKNIALLDSMDVFPKPSFRAGSNIHLTLQSGFSHLGDKELTSANDFMDAFSKGCLMGARGHQGVPFSMWVRGFRKRIYGLNEINPFILAEGFIEAGKTTKNACVSSEGEMWSVAIDVGKAALDAAKKGQNLCRVLFQATKQAKSSTLNTSNIIPLLRQAGLVHPGGLALFCLLNGMYEKATGDSISFPKIDIKS